MSCARFADAALYWERGHLAVAMRHSWLFLGVMYEITASSRSLYPAAVNVGAASPSRAKEKKLKRAHRYRFINSKSGLADGEHTLKSSSSVQVSSVAAAGINRKKGGLEDRSRDVSSSSALIAKSS